MQVNPSEQVVLFDPARRIGPTDGGYNHPDLSDSRWYDGDPDDEAPFDLGEFAKAGFQVRFVDMSDEDPEQYDRYSDAGDCDLSGWTPKTPEGGWWLVATFDAEDGLCAMFVRPIPEPPTCK